MFLSTVDGLASADSTWQCYLDRQQISDDGEVTSDAVKNGEASPDLEDFKQYCKAITGQGFHLEIVVDVDGNFHVVSWEEIEPDWPDELDPVLYLRWNTIRS